MQRRSAFRGLAAAAFAASLLPLPVSPARAEEAFVVEVESYSLREAPRGAAKATGRVKVGEKVFVVGRSAGWAQVEAGDRKGWLAEQGIGAEPPAALRLAPLQERVSGLETSVQELAAERTSLQEENARLSSRVGELEQSLGRAQKEAAAARSSSRIGEVALGGGLVIVGWLAGYGFAAARRRSGSTRYHIG